jgi:hypothetical protein
MLHLPTDCWIVHQTGLDFDEPYRAEELLRPQCPTLRDLLEVGFFFDKF